MLIKNNLHDIIYLRCLSIAIRTIYDLLESILRQCRCKIISYHLIPIILIYINALARVWSARKVFKNSGFT